MKITAVVVTYNRLEMLKKCLPSVLSQTRPVDEIIVINNCSTDGTEGWLKEFSTGHDIVKVTTLPTNLGGAGGFEKGVEMAVEQGADYVWIMDDDTFPTPTALVELLKPLEADPKAGFAGSRVEWTDGSLNKMNIPIFRREHYLSKIIDTITEVTLCDGTSFVSLLVPRRVVLKVGLPVGEFFIWHDDVEYTGRIVRAGYKGLYVPQSIVVHATASNIGSSIINAPVSAKHRFYYQIRNQMATKRMKTNPLFARVSAWLRLRRFKRAIAKRADYQQEFLEEVLNGYKDGKHFNPKVKFVKVK